MLVLETENLILNNRFITLSFNEIGLVVVISEKSVTFWEIDIHGIQKRVRDRFMSDNTSATSREAGSR